MRQILAAVLITVAAGGAAFAQGIEIGPGGVRVDDGRPRVIERRVIERRGDDYGGRRYRRAERCRTTIVRRENRYGEMVTRRIRECD